MIVDEARKQFELNSYARVNVVICPVTDAEIAVDAARDAVAFLHRSRGRILEELVAVDAEIVAAEADLSNVEARLHCGGAGEADPDGPAIVSFP